MATEKASVKTMNMFDTVTGSNRGTEVELHTTDGDPSGVKVRLLGPDSDEAIKADRSANTRNMKLHQTQQSKRIDVARDVIEKLVACITGWAGMPGEDGKDMPYSEDNARQVLTNYPSIRRELQREHEETANFTKASSAK
jgi:hypothetical protein